MRRFRRSMSPIPGPWTAVKTRTVVKTTPFTSSFLSPSFPSNLNTTLLVLFLLSLSPTETILSSTTGIPSPLSIADVEEERGVEERGTALVYMVTDGLRLNSYRKR